MQIVLSPTAQAGRICGQQKFRPDEAYRMTRHCVTVACDDGLLYYHTLTGALVRIGNDDTPENHREELVKYFFLVPLSFDEKEYALRIRKMLSLFLPKEPNRTSFTILTTTDCDARCFYCYERGAKRITMSPSAARRTADYIAEACGGEAVKLNWFGGEPLYNLEAIDIITAALRDKRISYSSKITTNGYLFDDAVAQRAKGLWRLKSAHIAVDGTKERYQKTKAYIYHDNNAYERVLDNIGRLLAHDIEVTVRMNMNRENAGDLSALCDALYERFHDRERFSVYPVLLKDFAGDVGTFKSDEEAVACYQALKEKLCRSGMLHLTSLRREIPVQQCMADNDACEMIIPDGRIGKCEHFSEADEIGRIDSPLRDTAVIASWKEQVTDAAECRDCPLYPRCIRLKKCAWTKDGCSEAVRTLRLQKLKEQILDAYLILISN